MEWRQQEARLQVHPTQVAAEADFVFANTGDGPVSFTDVAISCGCMNAKPLKPAYAPGEEGRLTIMIDLRNRDGELRKSVRIRTSEGNESTLSVLVDIPRAYAIDKPLLRWSKGEGATEKKARLTNPNAMPIRLHSITSSHSALPAELRTIREGFEYEVVIRRASDEADLRSVIRIATEPPPGETQSKTLRLYAVAP